MKPTKPNPRSTLAVFLLLEKEYHAAVGALVKKVRGVAEWFDTPGILLESIRDEPGGVDLILISRRHACRDDFNLIHRLHGLQPHTPIVVLVERITTRVVVQCVKAGADDVLSVQLPVASLAGVLLTRAKRLAAFRPDPSQPGEENKLIQRMGPSAAIKRMASLVKQVGPTGFSVLVEGESGTGKELVARRVHQLSSRRDGPWIPVDCGALSESLIEGELFGARKGSYTGAFQDRVGKVEAAHGGTLFLDEIGNLPPHMQNTLLRVLQEREVTPLGATQPRPVDIRLVCASSRSLTGMVEANQFRLDLYHRIAEFPIAIPPLRSRLDDLLYLAQRFLEETCLELRKPVPEFSDGAVRELTGHPWPGNARELRSAIRRSVLLSNSKVNSLHLADARTVSHGRSRAFELGDAIIIHAESLIHRDDLLGGKVKFKELRDGILRELEKELLEIAMAATGRNKSATARMLGRDYKTTFNKLKKYGLDAPPRRDRLILLQASCQAPASLRVPGKR